MIWETVLFGVDGALLVKVFEGDGCSSNGQEVELLVTSVLDSVPCKGREPCIEKESPMIK